MAPRSLAGICLIWAVPERKDNDVGLGADALVAHPPKENATITNAADDKIRFMDPIMAIIGQADYPCRSDTPVSLCLTSVRPRRLGRSLALRTTALRGALVALDFILDRFAPNRPLVLRPPMGRPRFRSGQNFAKARVPANRIEHGHIK